jgi:hypothetical protein
MAAAAAASTVLPDELRLPPQVTVPFLFIEVLAPFQWSLDLLRQCLLLNNCITLFSCSRSLRIIHVGRFSVLFS